jgi:hypothetical protein
LRELTRKAEAGEFTLGPMLMALIGSRKRDKKWGVAMPEQAVRLISLRRQMRLRFRAPSVGERSTASASIPAINARERRLDVTRRALAIPRLSQSSRG